ncbi:hypothetical protein ACFQER_14625 [Halomicroarcula sp. GCM10025894]|uniref:hypothetical protein n=1 Tax=Halomicroarcula sp. GCM10025894 TaxID=3252673 RepID=UPI0036162FB9
MTGSFIVEIGSKAAPGEYSLPVEARAGESDETVVSTAVITVEGQTGSPSPDEQDGTPSPQEQDGGPSPQQSTERQSPRGTD